MILFAKLGLLVAIFLAGLRLRFDLGTILLACTALVGVLFPVPLPAFAREALGAVFDRATLELVAVVLVTVLLGGLMREAGALREMTRSLGQLIGDYRLIVAIPPALIGLLPMPAGALVSAPLVEEAAGARPITPEARTFINYWFRHLWEYVWPLYPGLLIGAAVLHVPVERIALAQWPLAIVALAIGLWFLYGRLPRDLCQERRPRDPREGAGSFARSVWPLGAIFAGVFLLRLPILAALLATTLALAVRLVASRRLPARRLAALARDSISPATLLLLIAVMMFKRALDVSSALNGIPPALEQMGVSAFAPLFIAPFLVGLLTGVNQAYVAITFPILLPLMHGSGPGAPLDMSRVMFAYVAGFLGILLSPTHLCLAMTRDYFGAEFRGIYRLLAAPVACLFVAATGLLIARSL
jgi:uncharacterized protein